MKRRVSLYIFAFGLVILFGINTTSYAKQTQATASELINLDSDKDGYSDLCETLHKTNPNDKESTPSSNITINVPSDAGSIQEAINVAIDGDTIAVSEGTYKGNINFKGKSITLTSDSANTIIEGTEAGSVVTIDSNSTLAGFTITSKNIDARGIYVKDASPTIENCTIIGNKTAELGGGVFSTQNSSPKIINCIIIENGGTVQVYGGTPQISLSFVGDQGLVNTTANQQTVNTTEIITTEPQPPTTEPEVESANASYKPGELLVRFAPKRGVRLADAKKIENQRSMSEKKAILDDSLGGGEVKHEFKLVPGLSIVKLPPGLSVEKALEKFNKTKGNGGVLYAEPNYKIELFSNFPNETSFDQMWNMHNTGQADGTIDADIDAPEAWGIATGGDNEIIVAVIDSGIDYNHPDLAANMWINPGEDHEPLGIVGPEDFDGVDNDGNGYIDDIRGYDFCNNDNDPMDDNAHGTFCAGTIGAIGNNGIGVMGVNWNIKIMALKFMDSDGEGDVAPVIDAIEYATDKGAKVSNNSWGSASDLGQGLKDAIDAAGEAGTLFIAAAGNNQGYGFPVGDNDIFPRYPSNYDCENIISVMGTNRNDHRYYKSNYGPTTVDLGAPGSDIFSTIPISMGYYGTWDGTSMAAPHVAGACALLWSLNPNLSNLEVKNIILQKVDKVPDLEFGYYGGKMCVSGGRLNLFNVLKDFVWYVDDGAPLGGNGKSWETAFRYLQDALNNPQVQVGGLIKVAQGTYKPNQAETITIESGDRTATFQLVNGVTIKGGYKGVYNATGNDRDIVNYQTILSGDLLGNDGNPPNFASYGDNSYHVVTGGYYDLDSDSIITLDNTAILDGFTITGGNADGTGPYPPERGGGMYNYNSNPTVINCIFSYNKALNAGGGIFNGFIELREDDPPNNIIGVDLAHYTSSQKITNCIFYNNHAEKLGGGIFHGPYSLELTNCVFSGNSAENGGGIILGSIDSSHIVKLTNCTFYGNSATSLGDGMYNSYVNTIITNSIFWNNRDEIYNAGTSNPTVTYCNIKGGYPGEGNIGENLVAHDPLFVNANNPLSDGLRLKDGSPCIDAANGYTAPLTDILGFTRIDIPGIPNATSIPADMGAYEKIFAVVWYVDNNAELGGDGRSWGTAFKYLQDALNNPLLVTGNEIRVAEGTYKPDQDKTHTNGTQDYKATFRLINGVTIKGGYKGGDNQAGDERVIRTYQTILSGDIGTEDNSSDNSVHVVTGSNTDATAVLDGFTITRGHANFSIEQSYGCGMIIEGGSPTVINCNFTDNNSESMGIVVFIVDESSSPTFMNCAFYNNNSGSTVVVGHASPQITNCVFANNHANNHSGTALTISYNCQQPFTKITNCTFYGNDIALRNHTSGAIITNSIFWGNGGEIYYDSDPHTPKPTVTYSNVRGGWGGEGNIGENPVAHDPLFVNASNPAGSDGIFGTLDDGLQLKKGSQCISAANPDVAPLDDILGFTRDDMPDMGAYEQVTTYITAVVPGGKIYISTDYGDTWNAKDNNRNWRGVAVSFTGQYQTAVVYGGQIYVSPDYGEHWYPKDSNRYWYDVAMSPDGRYQTAVDCGGQIYVSTDYGENWSPKGTDIGWSRVAVSSTGEYQAAVAGNTIYVSSDSGENWYPKVSDSWYPWQDIAMSSDGSRLNAAIADRALIYFSTDHGDTWVTKVFKYLPWTCVAMSSDGSCQTALSYYEPPYVSIDYGNTWAPKWGNDDSCFGYQWQDVAMSSDGSVQAATTYDTETVSCLIYVSTDYGITWTAKGTEEYLNWGDVAVSH